MSCRSKEGQTVSPSTGKSVKEFLVDAGEVYRLNGGTLTEFSALIGRERGNWYAYMNGRCEPKVYVLQNAQSMTGVKLDDYLPELNAAVRLLSEVDAWKDALTKPMVDMSGIRITEGTRKGALRKSLQPENLRPNQAMGIYRLHEWWMSAGRFMTWEDTADEWHPKAKQPGRDEIVSETGKNVLEYVRAAWKQTGLTQGAFARAIKASPTSTSCWISGRNEPTAGILLRMEAVSGVKLDDYVPEIKRGIELLRNVPKWSDGFVRWKMSRFGLNFGNKRIVEAREGLVNEGGRLVPNMLIRLCRYYEFWIKYGDAGFKLSGGTLTDASEEEQVAFDAYQKAMGNAGVQDFDFHRLREGVWEFSTERWYRGEIDLNENELRIYFMDGALSFRRVLHAGA